MHLFLSMRAVKQRLLGAPTVPITPELVLVATSFSGGADPERVVAGELEDPFDLCLEPLDPDTIREHIELLRKEGILVAAAPDPLQDISQTAVADAKWLVRSAYTVAGDMNALGDAKEHEDELRQIGQSIAQARQQLIDAEARLRELRSAHIASQLERLGITSETRGLRLNIGPLAQDSLPGDTDYVRSDWLALGFPPAELTLDVRWGLPLPDGSCTCIYTAYLLQFIHYKREARDFLREIHRVLEPGGMARLIVPDLEGYLTEYAQHNHEFFATLRQSSLFYRMASINSELQMALGFAGMGTTSKPGRFFDHKYGYDFKGLAALLREVGFETIERNDYMQSKNPELNLDESSAWSKLAPPHLRRSIFVDVTK